MKTSKVISRIRRLRISKQAKADLLLLYSRCRKLVVGIVNYLQRHRRMGEALVLGALVAWLLSHVPVLGNLFGLLALVTSAAVGLMRELREDIRQLFEPALA